jgi:hypothetical protein
MRGLALSYTFDRRYPNRDPDLGTWKELMIIMLHDHDRVHRTPNTPNTPNRPRSSRGTTTTTTTTTITTDGRAGKPLDKAPAEARLPAIIRGHGPIVIRRPGCDDQSGNG